MSGERRVLRYEVPVDDEWHRIEIVGHVARAGCRRPDVVEFWTAPGAEIARVHDGLGRLITATYTSFDEQPVTREFRVFRTGQPIDDGLYVGTTYAAQMTELVWHLFARDVAS